MTAKVILNPYSNRWHAQKRWPEANASLKAAGIDFSLSVSQYHGQAEMLAKEAALQGYSPVIAAGGDGTIGEVVNGLAQAFGEHDMGTLGIMPLGTANDLVCNLGLPLELSEAAKIIAAGKTKSLDVCKAGERYFVNNSALGLEPYITKIQQEITWVKGIPRYLVAAVKGIFQHPTWNVQVEWDDGRYDGPLSLLSVGNAPRTGGLFFMAPHADPFDGKLTAVLAYKKTAISTLLILPKTMSPKGTYINSEGIHQIHTTRIRIQLDHPTPAHCDGELFPQLVDTIEYSILPGRLKVLL
ncbi:MAG: diacylglycerol kinase family lipid kinase, partial [Firmicutes bacterium]|nr:diacylglycerol kinase family lipid kinase [Bacillota bacterium]